MQLPTPRSAAAALFATIHLFTVTGCSTWQPAEGNVVALLAPAPADALPPAGGRNPRVSNDTLYGRAAPNARETAVPVADIRYVEVWKTSTGRTVLMVCSVVCSLALVVGGLNLATM